MAAGSVLEMLLRISGDSSDAVKAVKDLTKEEKTAETARKQQTAEQKKAWETLGNSIKKTVKLITTATLAIGGAMIAIAKSAANYGDEILEASEKTGESVENLSRLSYAAKIGETSLEELTNGMALLSRKMTEAADGGKEAQKAFSDIGIPIKNIDGSLRSATDVLLDFAEVAKNSNDNTRLTAQAMELFGRSGAQLIPFLKQGKVGIKELMEEADRLGITLDEKTARAGDVFNDSLITLNASLQGIRNFIGKEILPILTEYIKKLTDWIIKNREIIAQKVVDFFKGFISVIKTAVEIFDKWKYVILAVVAALGLLKIAAGIYQTISAFSKLIPLFASLAGKIGLSGGTLAKLGIAGAAAAVAIFAINKAFDFLNKNLDEAEKRTASLIKTQKKQEDVLAKISSGLGHDKWQQLIKDLDLVGKTSTERFGAIQQWAVQNKATNKEADQVWKLLNQTIGENKKKIEESRGALKTIPPVVKEAAIEIANIAKNLSKEILKIEADNLSKIVADENQSVESRRAAAERLFIYKNEILKREKQAEIEELEKSSNATTENLNLISQKYKLLGEQIKAENQKTQNEITEYGKKAIQERIDAEKKYTDTLLSIGQDIIKLSISKLEDELNAEEISKERKIQIAQEIFALKMKLLSQEMQAELEHKLANATTAEEKKKIEEEYAKYAALRQADVRAEWQKTKKEIEAGAGNLMDIINNILGSVSKGAANIQSGLSTIDKLLGTDTGGLQDAIGSGVAAFSSGASAVGSFMSGDVIGGISSALSAIGSIVDVFGALSESTQEAYVKQLERQGFNDTYSQELLDKMSAVAEQKGDKSYGMKAYIEDFFKETNIDTAEEFSRMSDLLNESIGEYIDQGHTVDEAYDKFGDELEQLTDAQEKYGFETTASLNQMVTLQKQQTKAGRVSGLTDVVSGIEKMLQGMSGYDYSQESWSSVFGMFQDAFKQLQSQGLSMQEIQAIIGPTMEKALKIAEEQGVDTSAIQQLKDFYAKMTGASGLLDVISGLNTAVTGLAETGSLTQENINQAAVTARETYEKLKLQGFSENEALAQIGPTLGEIASAAEQYGYTIPAGISDLVTAADAIGATGEKPIDETISDGLVEGFDRVVEVMRGFFGGIQSFRRGGPITADSGESEVFVKAHPGEYVIGPESASSFGLDALDKINQGIMLTKYVPVFNPATDTQQLAQELEKTSSDLKSQQAAFLYSFGGEIGKSLKEGIAAAMPAAGKTEVQTNVALNGNSLLKFLETSMNNGSLKINANAVKVQ